MSPELVQTLYSGFVLGSMYALMAMGLTLVWGGLGILNLTVGALYMLGAYTALIAGRLGLPPVGALGAGFLGMGLLGVLIYVGPLQRLAYREDAENSTILATFGLGVILETTALLIFGPRSREIPSLVSGQVRMASITVSWESIIMIVAAAVLLSSLGAILRWTRLGRAIRAIAQERDAAQLVGIGLHRTVALVMFLSSGLAGAGGILLSSYYFVSPYVGGTYLLTALVVTILGGLGSITGTLYAAYIIGLIQAFVSFFLGVRWSLPVLFAIIIAVLIVRPGGITGRVALERL